MKTALFARVSTKDQAEDGYSLDAQRKLLEEYASKRQLAIIRKFIVPESASGRQERKQFNEMVEFMRKNPDIKILVCEKVDRISRNFKDAIKIDDWLNEDAERQIHFVKESLVIHKRATSHERFQWDIKIVLSKQYSANLSEETRKGLTEKAAQNHYPGNHKRGYTTVGEIGHKLWKIDDSESSEAPYIKRAFELYDTGRFTTLTLGKHLLKEGWKSKVGKAIAKSEMHKILRDCFYCGEFVWAGKHYPNANHEPLISKELFYRVQDRIEKKIIGKGRRHSFLFSGLVKCGECGRSICAEIQKGHHYYRCTRYETACTQRSYTREEKIEEQILSSLDKLKIENERLAGWLRKALKESHADEIAFHAAALGDLNSRHTRTQQKIDTIYDEKIEGKISPEFYEKKLAQYSQELDEIIKSIARHKDANIDYVELGSAILDLTQRARKIYLKATPEKRRKLLGIVFSELQLRDKTITPVYNKAFDFLANRVNTLNAEEFTLEPKITNGKAVVLESDQNSVDWLRDLESNQDFRVQSATCYLYTIPQINTVETLEA